MEVIQVRKQELEQVIQRVTQDVSEPLYRALGKEAQAEYELERVMRPKHGNMSVGEGVFFTNSIEYAAGFLKQVLIVTAKEVLDPDARAIDTRIAGYETEAREALDKELGQGNYDGWRLWAEIQKNDTITHEGGKEDDYVYTKRDLVKQDKVIAEIRIID